MSKPKKPLPAPPRTVDLVASNDRRRDSVNIEGTMGFSDMLNETDRMILDGERGTVIVATAKWGFEARNDTEISFEVGAQIRVLDRHESGWWTGQYQDRTGFFPGNRTECQELDLAAYNGLQKKLLSQPMFPARNGANDDAPALPDPMVKAGKILGITEKEAEALASTSSRADRSASVSSPDDLVSPRKALAVLGFDEESPGKRRGSAMAKIGQKMSSGLRRLTNSQQQTTDRKNSVGSPVSPRGERSGSSGGSGAPSPRNNVKFADAPVVVPPERASPPSARPTMAPKPVAKPVVQEADSDEEEEEEPNESNLIY